MTNKQIANTFQFLGDIMELHGENPFKIRSYKNAYITLRKLGTPLAEIPESELSAIKGVGKAISGKITELLTTGKMQTLEKYKEKTPLGVQEMLNIKGFGPKKVKVIWKELDVESIGELLYAVNENRLIELKGFGIKTQEDLKKKLEYYQKSKNSFRYAMLEQPTLELLAAIQKVLPNTKIEWTGAMRRHANVVDVIEILVGTDASVEAIFEQNLLEKERTEGDAIFGKTADELPVIIYVCKLSEFGSKQFRYTATDEFLKAFMEKNEGINFKNIADEKAVFEKSKTPFVAPEMREQTWALELKEQPVLVEEADILGVLHVHTTYSDGLHSLREMCEKAKSDGYQYIGITDHSKSAFYANGLKPDRVLEQMAAIDELNKELAPFKIFKGTESDILADGRLDYEEDLLSRFDFIVASVHSNLRMDKAKATRRLLTAIANPHTTILGHPTGRLLLSREGYPIDHRAVIDACAKHGVAIELNANPYRLDLDWSWIPYAMEKGVKIAINPDAHSMEGIRDIHFGTLSARKGGLTKADCLNSLNVELFEAFLKRKKGLV